MTNSFAPAVRKITPSSAPTAGIDVTSKRSTISEINSQAIPVTRNSHHGMTDVRARTLTSIPPLGHAADRRPIPGRSVAEARGAASWSRSDEIGRLGGAGRLGRRATACTRGLGQDGPVVGCVQGGLAVGVVRARRLARRTPAPTGVRDTDAPVHVRVHVALEVVFARWQRGNGVVHGR